ncbi:protein FAM167B-like isoform X2 [Gigantopelta aegis]|uniref:protein FAM167B-like isoform X2 n=1 Tax=Gigantopelta aegis TaxID=1735272 RepID=UPI001B888DA2|nr:protein FAM167B-like isoform X2 [Gigantopelta aegis]
MGGNKEDGSHTPKENRRPLPVIKEVDFDDDKNNVDDIFTVPSEYANGRRRSSSSDSVSALTRLKETTARLKLTTRRASYIAWQAQCLEKPDFPPREELEKGKHGKLTAERMKRMDDAIDWLRNELEMKIQDQTLARQFLIIRNDIQQLKLIKSCEAHKEMLEDVHSEIEDLESMAGVLDLPTICINDNPLKHLGITRMNITRRRFSIF